MSYLMEQVQETDFNSRRQMLWQDESHIWKLKKDVANDTYKMFTLNDLFSDIFCKTAEADPLIHVSEVPKSNKDKLFFLLPENIVNQIKQYESANGDVYISDSGNNSDYNWPFRSTGDNVKIFKVIHLIFSEYGELAFISDIQKHITSILSAAQFTNMSKIKKYLRAVGGGIIVPEEMSEAAYNAFDSLVEANDRESYSLVIANFFISALLGLSPLNLYGKTFYKAYLLNKLGMEYIWTPELITVRYKKLYDLQQLYCSGYFKKSYKMGEEWIKAYKSEASKTELALALQLLGLSLYTLSTEKGNDEFEGRQAEGIELLESCAATGAADLFVSYFLYDCLKTQNIEKATGYLKTAFSQNYAKAVIEAAFLFLNGKKPFDEITEELLLEKINSIIENEQRNTVVDISECLYLRGRFLKLHGKEAEADEDFEAAAKIGNERAKQELSRKKRMERQTFPSFTNNPEAPCCYANSLTGNNHTVVSTFPCNEWAMYVSGETDKKDIHQVESIDEFIELQNIDRPEFCRPRIIFLFMSEDEEKNLDECLILLDKLFNVVLDKSETQRWQIINAIDIYVSANYETASMLIDANISDMGNGIYFKVHITDETRDCVHQLLCDAPLFIPFLSRPKHDDSVNVVLFGCSETNYRIIKESIGCAYLGKEYPISITMLGTGAERMERRFRQECPGIFHEPRIGCIRPKFISCCIEEEDFPGLIYGSIYDEQPDNELVRTLGAGNYFIVDLSSDHDSIKFATELRTWLLRSRGTFDRAPFIGVKCKNSHNSYLASHLTLSGQVAGDTYYSRYDLFPFGISRVLYSFNRLVENPRLEEVALQIHKSYYEGNDRQSENDYYSFSYNADSSMLTAIGISYRLFAGGAFFTQKEQYLNCGAFDSIDLLKRYVEAIKSKEESAAALEQSRWNGFMLSRGWEPADINQVRAYKDQSTGSSHKHTLAKLHPFIREWFDLDSDDLLSILGMLQSRFDYDKHPKSTTRKSIKDTPRFLDKSGIGKSIKDNEKTL